MPPKKLQQTVLPYQYQKPAGAWARNYQDKWELECRDTVSEELRLYHELKSMTTSEQSLSDQLIEAEEALKAQRAKVDPSLKNKLRDLKDQEIKAFAKLREKTEHLRDLLHAVDTDTASAELWDELNAEVALFASIESRVDGSHAELERKVQQRDGRIQELDRQKVLQTASHEDALNRLRDDFETRERKALAEQKSRLDEKHQRQLQSSISTEKALVKQQWEAKYNSLLSEKESLQATIEHDVQLQTSSEKAGLAREHEEHIIKLRETFNTTLFEEKINLERRLTAEHSKTLIKEKDAVWEQIMKQQASKFNDMAALRQELEAKHADKFAKETQALRQDLETQHAARLVAEKEAVQKDLAQQFEIKLHQEKQALQQELEKQHKSRIATEKQILQHDLEKQFATTLAQEKQAFGDELKGQQATVLAQEKQTLRNDLEKQFATTLAREKQVLRDELNGQHATVLAQDKQTLRHDLEKQHTTMLAQDKQALRNELKEQHDTTLAQEKQALRLQLEQQFAVKVKHEKEALRRELEGEHSTKVDQEKDTLRLELEAEHAVKVNQEKEAVRRELEAQHAAKVTQEKQALGHELEQQYATKVSQEKEALRRELEGQHSAKVTKEKDSLRGYLERQHAAKLTKEKEAVRQDLQSQLERAKSEAASKLKEHVRAAEAAAKVAKEVENAGEERLCLFFGTMDSLADCFKLEKLPEKETTYAAVPFEVIKSWITAMIPNIETSVNERNCYYKEATRYWQEHVCNRDQRVDHHVGTLKAMEADAETMRELTKDMGLLEAELEAADSWLKPDGGEEQQN